MQWIVLEIDFEGTFNHKLGNGDLKNLCTLEKEQN